MQKNLRTKGLLLRSWHELSKKKQINRAITFSMKSQGFTDLTFQGLEKLSKYIDSNFLIGEHLSEKSDGKLNVAYDTLECFSYCNAKSASIQFSLPQYGCKDSQTFQMPKKFRSGCLCRLTYIKKTTCFQDMGLPIQTLEWSINLDRDKVSN